MTRTRAHLLSAFVCSLILLLSYRVGAQETVTLTEDGTSAYTICLSPDATAQTRDAAELLRRYIEKVSGALLPVVSEASAPEKSVRFEVGWSVDKGVAPAAYGEDGFRIWTLGNRLYFTADTEQGIHNAVYTFLEKYLGCRKYSVDFETIPHTPTIELQPLDDTQIPRITFRMQDVRDSSYDAWHKLDNHDDWGLFVHTFKTLVPPEKYFNDHPEYFSENNGVRVADAQLCLTNPEVLRIVVEELRRLMAKNPIARFWSVSQNDTYVPCRCADCRALDSAEGSPSGSILSFVNKVANEFPDKTISTLAYLYSRRPPAHLKPAPNVNIMLCSIDCNRSEPIPGDPSNTSFVRDLKDWSALTHNIFLWDYVVQFRNLVSPFPNLRTLQPNMQFFVENGITSVFEQGVASMQGEFAELRIYLLSKLLWDPYIDIDSVMNDFLDGYYGAAGPHIREYIDAEHNALATSGEDLSIYGYPYPSENGYLSAKMLDSYEAIFAEAESAVRGDSTYLWHVYAAHLPVQYAILEQARMLGFDERGFFERAANGSRRTRPEMEGLLQTFYDRCKRVGITRLWEHGNPPDYYLESTRRFIDDALQPHRALERPVALSVPASAKYHHGESSALTDGLTGRNDYHFHWLGFEGTEMEATVDLGAVQPVARIETCFLQDILSWVFMPQSVEFSVSEDGETFRTVGVANDTIPPERSDPVVAPFDTRFAPTQARFVRVTTRSYKTCPVWHKGAGGKAWIFIDEIKVF